MTTMKTERASVEMVKNDTALIRLTEKNKENLLNETLQRARSRKGEALEILANVNRLTPHWAPFLSLKDVAVDAAPLRLMCSLDSELFTDTSTEMGSYIAVSYCWRNAEWKPIIDTVCDPWNFCEPIVKSLLQLRKSIDEGVWVDEKCINQANEGEKQVIIGAMDVIYRSARLIVILLEDVQLSHEMQDTVLKFSDDLNSTTAYVNGLTGATPGEVSVLADAFDRILSARWFSRAWCVHEFRIIDHLGDNLSMRPLFPVLGPTGEPVFQIPLATLVNLMYVLLVHYKWHSFGSDNRTRALLLNFTEMSHFSPIQKSRGMKGLRRSKRSLMREYIYSAKRGVSEPQDQVQIALNLCDLPIACSMGDGFKLEGNREQNLELTEVHAKMKLLDTCYSLFSCIAMAAGDFSALTSIGRPLNMYSSKENSMSWLRYMQGAELTTSHPAISPQCIRSLGTEYIDLDLLFFPSNFYYASPAAKAFASSTLVTLEMARRKIPMASHGELGRVFEGEMDNLNHYFSETEEEYIMSWLCEMLALALDCGVEWMSAAGDRMRRDIMDQSFWLGKTHPNESERVEPWLRDTALQILSFGQQSRHPNIANKTSRQYCEKKILPIIRFLDLVTDPRFRAHTFGPELGRIVSPEFKGPHETLGILKGYIPVGQVFAIPVALSTKDYIVATRVWVLQSFDTGGSKQERQAWRVVDKLALMFDHVDGIKDGVNGARLERAQRVYGAPFWWEIPH